MMVMVFQQQLTAAAAVLKAAVSLCISNMIHVFDFLSFN